MSMKMQCAIITDEEPSVVEVLRYLLSPWFKRIYTTSLDHKIAKVAKVDPPDLIVTNITRFGCNGLDLVKVWRENPGTMNAAIWVVSGSTEANLVKLCKSRVDMFFEKPFNPKDIRENLKRLAESKLLKEDN